MLQPVKAQLTIDDLINYFDSLRHEFEMDLNNFPIEVLAKAKPDECYYGPGDMSNQYVPTGIDCATCETNGGRGKTNQAYVWGLTNSDSTIWFGTAPNVHCLVIGQYFGGFLTPTANETNSYVCEFGDGPFSPPYPDGLGDWRPSRMYSYNLSTKTLTDRTPAHPFLAQTVGIRSAGAHNGVVLFGGPGLGGVKIFAYNAATGAFLGAANWPAFTNIRKWLVVDGVLYAAVGTATGGHVIRWTGNLMSPFTYEIVGNLESDGAELALHEGRLFVNTWPSQIGTDVAELYMSPPIPPGGLTNAHAASWQSVWKATDYEPNLSTALTYGGGALISFQGYLFWGTMHVPMASALAHFIANPPADEQDLLLGLLGSYRAISIFRGKNFATTPQIDIAYGMPFLPKYDAMTGWSIVPNKMNKFPLFGLSGFGNPFNNYTWSMAIQHDRLYVGTMDWSYLLLEDLQNGIPKTSLGLEGLMKEPGKEKMMDNAMAEFAHAFDPNTYFGADLFCFHSAREPAKAVSLNGLGNPTSYGIRNMINYKENLYMGMANPMNLLSCSNSTPGQGGWELIKSTPASIPTIGVWAIIVLALLLVILPVVYLTKQRHLKALKTN